MDLVSLKAHIRALRRQIYRETYRGYGPMPHLNKLHGLSHVFIPGAPLIETGTYWGDSTRYFSRSGFPVHTIEVSEALSSVVFPSLRARGVVCHSGDSGELMPKLLDSLIGKGFKSINFWLDGHWSGGVTAHSPEYETPIIKELIAIAPRVASFDHVCIAIDDLRCFGNDSTYPPKTFLLEWAREVGLEIYFLADIFVASTEKYSDI